MSSFYKINNIIIIFLLLGFFARFYHIKETFFWGSEQALTISPIIRMFEEKKIPLIGMHLINYKSALFRTPFFIYIFAVPLKLFHFNPLSLEICFALIGVINIYIIYLIATKYINKRTAIISALFYAVSFNIIYIDKNVWTITPIIITTFLIFYAFTLFLLSKRPIFALLTGSLLGLGFSFHFQIVIILISISIIFIIKYRGCILPYILGLIILLAPLIIFNVRHNFIMINGFKNFFTGNVYIKQNTKIIDKVNNSFSAFSDLGLLMLSNHTKKNSLPINILIVSILFLLPAIFQYKITHLKNEKTFLQIFFLNCLLLIFFLSIIDQGQYSSTSFYLWFLIPSIILLWARFLDLILNTKLRPIIIMIIIIFIGYQFFLTIFQEKSDYSDKIKLIDNILSEAHKKDISIKLINRDVLIYDSLFYYRAPLFGLKYGQINLIEQWQSGNPNFYIIHNSYNWNEDKYSIKPFQKMMEFDDIKLVIKNLP